MGDGKALDMYAIEAGRNIKETPAILDKVISDYLESEIDILLIAGDITRNGEKQSHIDFVAKLRPLIDNGVRVFVVPGNHDINMPNAVRYQGDSVLPVDNISPADFEAIYNDCGYSSAIRRDTASLSYVSVLNDNTWLLALDGCKYREYTDVSISSGRISADTERWILEVLTEAKRRGVRVLSMMHHGLAEHFMYQDMFFPQYLIDDWKRLAGLFADNGVKVVFTGHFHANDITRFTSDSNNTVYDIETGSLSTYPYPYRLVELSDKGVDISTKNIKSIPSNPNLYMDGKARVKDWAQHAATQKLRSMGYSFLEDKLSQIADVASDIIVLHVEGDEVIDENLQRKITRLASGLELPMLFVPENIQIDFPPQDNHYYIPF